MPSRRDFLRNALVAGAMFTPLSALSRTQGRGRIRTPLSESEISPWSHRIISLDDWSRLKADFEEVRKGEGFSRQSAFRSAMDSLDFALPKDFPGAKFVIVLATFAKSAVADFVLNGKSHRILIPYQYYADDWTPERLKDLILKEILKDPGRRIVDISKKVPLKYLAGRSGLGSFGRNNLIYIEGMGSFCLLHAFLTDAPLSGAALGEHQLLNECRHCHACDRSCPTDCLGRTRFLLDAGRCLSLINENPGDFPNWILPSMHHALMGCLKCQTPCPENERIPELFVTLGTVPEEDTRKILQGRADAVLTDALRKKGRLFPAVSQADFLPILKRNLGVLIRA